MREMRFQVFLQRFFAFDKFIELRRVFVAGKKFYVFGFIKRRFFGQFTFFFIFFGDFFRFDFRRLDIGLIKRIDFHNRAGVVRQAAREARINLGFRARAVSGGEFDD